MGLRRRGPIRSKNRESVAISLGPGGYGGGGGGGAGVASAGYVKPSNWNTRICCNTYWVEYVDKIEACKSSLHPSILTKTRSITSFSPFGYYIVASIHQTQKARTLQSPATGIGQPPLYFQMSRTSSNVIPQTPPPPPPPPHSISAPITIILTVVLLIFFLMGFFSIYFCKCFIQNLINIWQFRRNPSGIIAVANAPANPGLDSSLIQSFPTFTYSTVKNLRHEKYGLECAICLAEFEDDDLLRLLTVCYHVFHQECIDLWLQSHKTCPVCRRDLDLPKESLEKSPVPVHDLQNGSIHSDSISISIKDDDVEEINRGDGDLHYQVAQNGMKRSERRAKIDRFPRSHSTGHSIGRSKEEEEDRHRMRLQEHVKIEITRGQHHSAISCITFGEISHHKNGGFGERSGFSFGDINKV
ncbi:RING-H2 finger protein ATL29-like [Tripterygium wilfordii]|uniref:RING-type E3 ubiquitin transferase n=1 Tax=Tripterygium wilfordii TaxID=458696 RepID=A0A7J7CLV6_TRIWF|nr:RING-H2 finger protein ATL29-like [Tripterygium wilfordii]